MQASNLSTAGAGALRSSACEPRSLALEAQLRSTLARFDELQADAASVEGEVTDEVKGVGVSSLS